MYKRLIKLLSCFIPDRKLRRKFREKFSPKNSVISDKGKNNRLIILDDDGNETDSKYIKNLKIYFEGDNSEFRFYQSTYFDSEVIICCKSNVCISMGKNLYAGSFLFPICVNDNVNLIIGDNVLLGETSIYLCDEPGLKVEIGDDCMFSSDIIIRPSDGHAILNYETKQPINYPQNIKIGNRCWIGKGVRILKGADIPDNSVVGMGSIYTRGSNPSDTTVLNGWGVFIGTPARLDKTGITWDKKNTYDYLKDKERNQIKI